MKLPSKFIIMVFLLAGHFLFLHNAMACVCRENKTPCEEYGTANLVFSGKAIQITDLFDHNEEKDPEKRRVYGRITRFHIDKLYKGSPASEVDVFSWSGAGDCGFSFSKGYQYLVYAYGKEGKDFRTDICTRTVNIEKAKQDLEFLDGLSGKEPGGTISGRVEFWPVYEGRRPMPDVPVKIQTENRLITMMTDKEGQYRISGIAPGTYKVTPELPAYLGTGRTGLSEEILQSLGEGSLVTVTDRGCAKKDFMVRYDGRISGKVVDAKGRPLKNVSVELIETENASNVSNYINWFFVYTDDKGIYEFTMLQPDYYVLGININSPPDFQTPYPRTYFSGLGNAKKRKTILVRGGEKLKGYNFHLPPQIPEREIKGRVLQADGKPVVGAKVALDLKDSPNSTSRISTVDVNAEGEFVIKGLRGLKYSISAYFDQTKPQWKRYQTAPIQIFVDKNMQPLTLKFSEK